MSFAEYFPVWDKLDKAQQKMLLDSVTERSAKAGTVLYTGGSDCLGLVVVKSAVCGIQPFGGGAGDHPLPPV